MGEMRRNQRILLFVFVIGIIVYILINSSSSQSDDRYDNKERLPVSTFLRRVTSNDSLFRDAINQHFFHPDSKAAIEHYLRPSNQLPAHEFKSDVLKTQSDFNIETDVIVYLHIQKVGGTTFNSHLMKDLNLETPCQCEKDMLTNPCHCKNKNGYVWLFSWFSVGWPCGLHADWTMLHECVDDALNAIEGKPRLRRYFYVTLIRDPISRYLSEWKHLRMGHHWQDTHLRCGGKSVSNFDIRPCFSTRTWAGVTLDEFMECKDNLATNRQTRMIADLTKSHCYHRNELKQAPRSALQLKSAMENIENMAFVGVTRFQKNTQSLFEKTFNLKFNVDFQKLDDDDQEDEQISEDEFVSMMKYIELDVQLYQRARELFMARTKGL